MDSYDLYGQRISNIDGRAISVNASGVASLIPSQVVSYTTNYTYTANGDLASESTPPIFVNGASSAAPVTTTYGYSTDGQLIRETSANGNSTTYSYDQLGRQTTITEPPVLLYTNTLVTPTEQTSYDGEGHVIAQTDANGDVTTDSYDPQGRLVAETNPVSGTTLYTYTATEQSMLRDPQGNVTSYGYDVAGRLITVTAPISGVTQYAYDPAGNTTVMTNADTQLNPIQVDTRQYDALNRMIVNALSGPGSTPLTTTTRYDTDGNVYQVVHPNGDAVVSTYDLADELASTEVNTSTVSAATHATQSTFGYDAAGNQTQSTDYGGNSTTTTYDGDNRIVQSVAVTGTSTLTSTNTYDADGNVITATLQASVAGSPQQTSTDSSTYNAADWQSSLTDNGLTTTYGYDAAGQERTRTTNNGQVLYTLDAEGRTTAISATTAGVSTYGYNADDLPITTTLPGGITGTMGYNPNSQLTGWSYLGPSTGVTTTVNLAYNYSYDAAYRTSGITVTDNNVSTVEPITHAAADWITGWTGPQPNGTQTWAYNGDGNIISTTGFINGGVNTTVYTYSATQPSELVQQHTNTLGVDTYTYDGQGNVVSEVSTDPITSPYYVNMHFGYDPLERPISMTNVQNGATITITLGYNALSERITYTAVMSGQVVSSGHFSYNDDGSLAQTIATTATLNADGSTKSSGAYTDTYAYDPQGAPLYLLRQQNGTTRAYTYLTEGHGNVVELTDGSGNVIDRYAYDLWGQMLSVNETVPQQRRYAGYWYDRELGWYWLNVRSYDPVLKRSLQSPNSGRDGARSYTYAGDNPIDTIDRTGTWPELRSIVAATPEHSPYAQFVYVDGVVPPGAVPPRAGQRSSFHYT